MSDNKVKNTNTNEAVNEFNQTLKGESLTADAWKRLRKNHMAMFGLVMVGFYALMATLAPILPIHAYDRQVLDHQYLPPSLTKTAGELMIERQIDLIGRLMAKEKRTEMNQAEKDRIADMEYRVDHEIWEIDGKEVLVHKRRYLLGTDDLGRDLLSRIIYGGQVSMAIGLIGTITSVIIGIVIGAIAGYVGGKVDYFISRFIEVMYGLPYMLLVIILMAIFGKNIFNLFIALSVVSWLTTARVMRGQIMSLKNSIFVEAARSMGASPARIIFKHLVPNTLGIIIVYATLRVPAFIMLESFLSFLGLGVSAPYASWGSLIQDSMQGMTNFPWRLIAPAFAMALFLFSMNFLGDGLRDAFDPQSKNRV
ncbi:ABC transporter permease [Spirochaeta isovalerica]|uniref:Oligopeptide transport system permease protein OppC n=1 Tax=Spirochaeta isovalerica TaxID=150 RepID=A0A841RFJ8_9SPIO|nr:ABC transporter permease [Spirochaeta isovalerica]MBB6481132.1 oligopeptide transport system permease protein [Spirochaeta isovalerica]